MHIVINAASAHMGGAVTFLRNLLRWLPKVARGSRFTVFAPEATCRRLSVQCSDTVELLPYPFASTSGVQRIYFDQVYLPRRLRSWGSDILFSTTGFGTLLSPCPQVLLVRNLAYFDPEFHKRYKELGRSLRKNTVRRWHSFLSMRTADVVLFPTQAMLELVASMIPLHKQRVRAIHYGFDASAVEGGRNGEAPLADTIKQFKEEGWCILLHVSTYAVQKNVETLVDALARLRKRGCKAKVLTTISRERTTDTQEYDALQQQVGDLGVREDFLEVGYVSYDSLGRLYDLADAYVFPSVTESFGHSLVEAMALGVPVIASNTAVNREVCGDAAAYFDTFDGEDCAGVMQTLLGSSDVRDAMISLGRDRASQFTWERYATLLWEEFEHVVRTKSSDAQI